MRILFIILALASFSSFANTSAQCKLVNGLYKNSSIPIDELNFETLVDVFKLSNANTLNIDFDGKRMKLTRTEIAVNRQTKIVYQQRNNNKITRTIHVMIDRTPKEVSEAREFFGNMIILPEGNEVLFPKSFNKSKSLVYNFHCEF